ncbi:MAG: hypothetical protein J5875_10505 [Paludibacteraceae bacterium]|nr:hypothetical protein [Paludibacteraceae bacterium]
MSNWYLCYNSTKGFYCSKDSCITNDILCCSHEKKGFDKQTAKVEEKGIEIDVHSNFGFGSKSYLYAEIQLNGKSLFNFEDLNMLHAPNGFNPKHFYVRPVDNEWETLFKKVANNCNNSLLINSGTIRDYFFELNRMIDSQEVEIYEFVREKVSVWNGSLLVLSLVSRQLTIIIENLEDTVYNFAYVNTLLVDTCKHFLQRFKLEYNSLNLDDERAKRIVASLLKIHQYMSRQNDVDFITSLM